MREICSYYQAKIFRPESWFLVAALRSFEHVAFDRTLDVETNLFEFFVPVGMEPHFLELMHYFQEEQVVLTLEKLPNRLSDESVQV